MTRSTQMPNYQIIVEGTLDSYWHDCLGGLAISVRERPERSPITVLAGPLADQAALQGVLETLFMLNVPLVLVERRPQEGSGAFMLSGTGAISEAEGQSQAPRSKGNPANDFRN
jgi:hypothetical protein